MSPSLYIRVQLGQSGESMGKCCLRTLYNALFDYACMCGVSQVALRLLLGKSSLPDEM